MVNFLRLRIDRADRFTINEGLKPMIIFISHARRACYLSAPFVYVRSFQITFSRLIIRLLHSLMEQATLFFQN